MAYEILRYRIQRIQKDGIEIPIQGNEKFKDSLEIMVNLDIMEADVLKSDLAESKKVLEKYYVSGH